MVTTSPDRCLYNGFDSITEAVAATDKYDPFSPSPELTALRQVKYSAIFKPLKEYTLGPGFERRWRLKITNENIQAFVSQIAALEKALRATGHSINPGVFQPIGGGVHEAYHLRAASPTSTESGKVLEEDLAGAAWMSIRSAATSLVEEVVSDNFEMCEIIQTQLNERQHHLQPMNGVSPLHRLLPQNWSANNRHPASTKTTTVSAGYCFDRNDQEVNSYGQTISIRGLNSKPMPLIK